MLHHIDNQTYNHILQLDNIMKQRSDDSTGLDSDGGTIQSGNTEHEEEEEKSVEGQAEEEEQVSVSNNFVNSVTLLSNVVAGVTGVHPCLIPQKVLSSLTLLE